MFRNTSYKAKRKNLLKVSEPAQFVRWSAQSPFDPTIMETRHLMGSPVSSHHYPHFPSQTLTLIGTFVTFSKILNFYQFQFFVSTNTKSGLSASCHFFPNSTSDATTTSINNDHTTSNATTTGEGFHSYVIFQKKSNFRISNIKKPTKSRSARRRPCLKDVMPECLLSQQSIPLLWINKTTLNKSAQPNK